MLPAVATASKRTSARVRRRAAAQCAGTLDSDLFRALGEPARIELVRLLIARGPSDLGALAGELPQDASVISRHLAVLHRAGVVRRDKRGRHVHFELDGPALVARLDEIVREMRKAVPFCCPGGAC